MLPKDIQGFLLEGTEGIKNSRQRVGRATARVKIVLIGEGEEGFFICFTSSLFPRLRGRLFFILRSKRRRSSTFRFFF